MKIAATKVSAGVSTGIGDHASKYEKNKEKDINSAVNGHQEEGKTTEYGDEQFEIDDGRSLDKMYEDIAGEGLQPVLNDYLYV